MRSVPRVADHDEPLVNRDALRAFVDACPILIGQVDVDDDESTTLLRELLMRVLKHQRPASMRVPTANFRVARALTFLEEHFADTTLDLASAARHVGITPSHLDRLLKEHSRLTFLQHLRQIRMRHAERLLLTTTASIKEASYQCGYAAVCSFGRDFKRTHGCTPRVWREIRTLCRV